MSNEEIDLEQFAVTDLRWIVVQSDGLGVAGAFAADLVVARIFGAPASIAGRHAGHALHMLEDPLHAPKAPAGKDRSCAAWRRACRRGDESKEECDLLHAADP